MLPCEVGDHPPKRIGDACPLHIDPLDAALRQRCLQRPTQLADRITLEASAVRQVDDAQVGVADQSLPQRVEQLAVVAVPASVSELLLGALGVAPI